MVSFCVVSPFDIEAQGLPDPKSFQFTSVQASVHNHFNQEGHPTSRNNFRHNRNAALNEWRKVCVA
jgi:hypothetical protein